MTILRKFKYIFIYSTIFLFIFGFLLNSLSFNIESIYKNNQFITNDNYSNSSKHFNKISKNLENESSLSQTKGNNDICLVVWSSFWQLVRDRDGHHIPSRSTCWTMGSSQILLSFNEDEIIREK